MANEMIPHHGDRERTPQRMVIRRDENDLLTWLFTDARGDVWRLRATYDPHTPIEITPEQRS